MSLVCCPECDKEDVVLSLKDTNVEEILKVEQVQALQYYHNKQNTISFGIFKCIFPKVKAEKLLTPI